MRSVYVCLKDGISFGSNSTVPCDLPFESMAITKRAYSLIDRDRDTNANADTAFPVFWYVFQQLPQPLQLVLPNTRVLSVVVVVVVFVVVADTQTPDARSPHATPFHRLYRIRSRDGVKREDVRVSLSTSWTASSREQRGSEVVTTRVAYDMIKRCDTSRRLLKVIFRVNYIMFMSITICKTSTTIQTSFPDPHCFALCIDHV